MNDFDKIPSVSPLLDDSLRAQLSDILQKINRDVYLISILDEENEKSLELAVLIKDIAALGFGIHAKLYAPGENRGIEKELSPEGRLPAVGIYDDALTFTGIVFYGVPGGKELNSLVISLYNVGGKGQDVEDKTLRKIEKIKVKTHIQVFISLSCHHCAQMVMAAQRIASLNPLVRAEMIDANLFPDLVERHHIERVPITIINGSKRIVGAKTIAELSDIIYHL